MSARRWSTARITLVLYPFGAGAMVLNVYFFALILSWCGVAVISPVTAIVIGLPLGIPATWLFSKHIQTLIDLSEAGQQRLS